MARPRPRDPTTAAQAEGLARPAARHVDRRSESLCDGHWVGVSHQPAGQVGATDRANAALTMRAASATVTMSSYGSAADPGRSPAEPSGRRGQPIRGVVASTRGSVTQPDSARRTSHFGPLEERLHARCWANQDLTGPICTGAIDGGLGSRLWTMRPVMLASGDPRPGVLAGQATGGWRSRVCGRGSISDCPRAVVSFHGHRLSEHMLLSPGDVRVPHA